MNKIHIHNTYLSYSTLWTDLSLVLNPLKVEGHEKKYLTTETKCASALVVIITCILRLRNRVLSPIRVRIAASQSH